MKTSKSALSFVAVCAVVASLHGAVPETGLTWNFDGSGVSGSTVAGTFANAEGVQGYEFETVGGMTWTNDVGVSEVFSDIRWDNLLCTNATALYENKTGGSNGVRLPGATEALGLTNDFTIEFMIKVGAGNQAWSRILTLNRAPVLNSAGTGNENAFAFIFQTSTTVVDGFTSLHVRIDSQTNHWERTGGFNQACCSTSFTAEQWHLISFTYEYATKTATMYVDGARVASATTTHPMQFDGTNNPLILGERFVGALDCLKFTPRALKASEVMYSYMKRGELGLPTLGHWRFENGQVGANPTASDLVSSANAAYWPKPALSQPVAMTYTNEVYSSGAKFLVDGENGDLIGTNAQALTFAKWNIGTYALFPATRTSVLSNFTAECFFKDNGAASQFTTILSMRRPDVTYEEYVENGDGTVATNTTTASNMALWFMTVGATSLRIRADCVPETGVKPNNGRNWNQCADCTTSIKDGKWHHLAVTYDYATSNLTAYVDYRQEASVKTSYPLPILPGQLEIGASNANASRWADYTIDEVRISEGVLPTSSFLRFRAALGTTVLLR